MKIFIKNQQSKSYFRKNANIALNKIIKFKTIIIVISIVIFICSKGYSENITPDQYENNNGDNSIECANRLHIAITKNIPHLHNFHTRTDEDWFVFYGIKNIIYKIAVIVETLESSCNAVIEIYDIEHSQLVYWDRAIEGKDEIFFWTECIKDDLYFIRLTHSEDSPFGSNTAYDIRLYLDVAPFNGDIKGKVLDIYSLKSITYGKIKTNEGFTAVSMPEIDEDYFIYEHRTGCFQLFAEAQGYISWSEPVDVLETIPTNKDIYMHPDFDDDNRISLRDVIIALKVLSGNAIAKHRNINGIETVIGIMIKIGNQ